MKESFMDKNRKTCINAILSSLFLLFSASNTMAAQNSEEDAETVFRFIYIAYEEGMRPSDIQKKIQNDWNEIVINHEGRICIYLSRGEIHEPIIVDFDYDVVANQDDKQYNIIEKEIYAKIDEQSKHPGSLSGIKGETEKQRILDYLNLSENDFVDSQGILLYKKTRFDFCVGPKFLEKKNGESLIASLYFELDIRNYYNDNVSFKVFGPESKKIDDVVGQLNPDGCKERIDYE